MHILPFFSRQPGILTSIQSLSIGLRYNPGAHVLQSPLKSNYKQHLDEEFD